MHTSKPIDLPNTSPVEMGLRLIKDGSKPEIYCPGCNVWYVWAVGTETCPNPKCRTEIPEAVALSRGMQSAQTILKLGGDQNGQAIVEDPRDNGAKG